MGIGVPILGIPKVPILDRGPILEHGGPTYARSPYFSFCDMLIVYLEVYVAHCVLYNRNWVHNKCADDNHMLRYR